MNQFQVFVVRTEVTIILPVSMVGLARIEFPTSATARVAVTFVAQLPVIPRVPLVRYVWSMADYDAQTLDGHWNTGLLPPYRCYRCRGMDGVANETLRVLLRR